MKRILRFNSEMPITRLPNLKAKIEDLLDRLNRLDEGDNRMVRVHQEKILGQRIRVRLRYEALIISRRRMWPRPTKTVFQPRRRLCGYELKKDEFICNCSSIDDIIIFYRDGRYKITKVQDKLFVGKGVIYINVYKRNDQRTIYNVIYQNGRGGVYYMKRFAATGMSRDKEYSSSPATLSPRCKDSVVLGQSKWRG